jgi:hypothetical protein
MVTARDVGSFQRPISVPGASDRCFAPRMSELNRRHCTLFANKVRDPPQAWNLNVIPDSEVAMSVAAALLDCRGFNEDQTRATLREFAEMHDVPISWLSIPRHVLTHRRNDDAIFQLNRTDSEGFKEQRVSHRRLFPQIKRLWRPSCELTSINSNAIFDLNQENEYFIG